MTMGMMIVRASGGESCTATVPIAEPIRQVMMLIFIFRILMAPFLIKVIDAESVPKDPCSLLVASACTGGVWNNSKAGSVMRPPPPATASIKPAKVATKASIKIVSIGYRYSMKEIIRFRSLAFVINQPE